MKIEYHSLLQIRNAGQFHPELHRLFDPSTRSHFKGDRMDLKEEHYWDGDYFGIIDLVGKTETVEPQINCLRELFERHAALFHQIRAGGGTFNFVLACDLYPPIGHFCLTSEQVRQIAELNVSLQLGLYRFSAPQ